MTKAQRNRGRRIPYGGKPTDTPRPMNDIIMNVKYPGPARTKLPPTKFIGSASGYTAGNVNVTITPPTALQNGDLMVVYGYFATTPALTTLPDGWTAMVSAGAGNMWACYKVADEESGAAYTFTTGGATRKFIGMVVYRNVNLSQENTDTGEMEGNLALTGNAASVTLADTSSYDDQIVIYACLDEQVLAGDPGLPGAPATGTTRLSVLAGTDGVRNSYLVFSDEFLDDTTIPARTFTNTTGGGPVCIAISIPATPNSNPKLQGNFIPKSIITAKGDIIVGTATGIPSVVSVGPDGTVLTADAASTPGVKWSVVPEPGKGAHMTDIIPDDDPWGGMPPPGTGGGGAAGSPGATGATGPTGPAVYLEAPEPDEPWFIGPVVGATGATGGVGPAGPVVAYVVDEPEEQFAVPMGVVRTDLEERLPAKAIFSGLINVSLSVDTNNWAPTGLSGASQILVTPNVDPITITGITGGTQGRYLVIRNSSGVNYIKFTHWDTASTTTNRIFTPDNQTFWLGPNHGIILIYEAEGTHWTIQGPVYSNLPATGMEQFDPVAAPSTVNGFPIYTIPDSGYLDQRTRLTLTTYTNTGGGLNFADRQIIAGTGRTQIRDKQKPPSYEIGSYLVPSLTVGSDEFLMQYQRAQLNGNTRITVLNNGRSIVTGFNPISRLVLAGAGGGS